jgi:hypothetical protein
VASNAAAGPLICAEHGPFSSQRRLDGIVIVEAAKPPLESLRESDLI